MILVMSPSRESRRQHHDEIISLGQGVEDQVEVAEIRLLPPGRHEVQARGMITMDHVGEGRVAGEQLGQAGQAGDAAARISLSTDEVGQFGRRTVQVDEDGAALVGERPGELDQHVVGRAFGVEGGRDDMEAVARHVRGDDPAGETLEVDGTLGLRVGGDRRIARRADAIVVVPTEACRRARFQRAGDLLGHPPAGVGGRCAERLETGDDRAEHALPPPSRAAG